MKAKIKKALGDYERSLHYRGPNLIFIIKPFFYMTKKSKQKFLTKKAFTMK